MSKEALESIERLTSDDNYAFEVDQSIRAKLDEVMDLPRVSADVKLGKAVGRGKTIEVDEAALAQTLDHARIKESDRSQIDIVLAKSLPGYRTSEGLYYPDEKSIYLKWGEGAQKTLQHEVKHFADDISGAIYPDREKLYTAGVRYALPVSLTGIALNGAALFNRATETVTMSEQMSHNTALGGSALAATGIILGLGYYLDAGERSARKAEKANLSSAFHVEKYKGRHRK